MKTFWQFLESFDKSEAQKTMSMYGPWRNNKFRYSYDSDMRASMSWLDHKDSSFLGKIALSNLPPGAKLIDYDGDAGWERLLKMPDGSYVIQRTVDTPENNEIIYYLLYPEENYDEIPQLPLQKFIDRPPLLSDIKWEEIEPDEEYMPKTWINAVYNQPYDIDWDGDHMGSNIVSSKYSFVPNRDLVGLIDAWRQSNYNDIITYNAILDWLKENASERDIQYFISSVKKINTIVSNRSQGRWGLNQQQANDFREELFEDLVNYLLKYRD